MSDTPDFYAGEQASNRGGRSALRGYIYQATLALYRWLSLGHGESLLCECRLDIDRQLANGQWIYEEVKDHRYPLNIADAPVRTTLVRFLKHHVASARLSPEPQVQFLFSSTAKRRNQLQSQSEFDLLRDWDIRTSRKRVVDYIRATVASAAEEEVDWLDRNPRHWIKFVRSVEWRFEEPSLRALQGLVSDAIGALDGPQPLAANGVLQDWLLGRVLECSYSADQELRVLTCSGLQEALADANEGTLEYLSSAQAQLLKEVGLSYFAALESVGEKVDEVLNARALRGVRQMLDAPILRCPPDPTAGDLLDPHVDLVPFHNRTEQLEELDEWALNGDEVKVLVVAGAPGTGKSRLLSEWTGKLAHRGELVGFLRDGFAPDRVSELLEGPGLRIIVVDEAYSRPRLVEKLLDEVAPVPAGPRDFSLRLVLVIRNYTDWIVSLRDRSLAVGRLLRTARELVVGALGESPADRMRFVELARSGFAKASGQSYAVAVDYMPPGDKWMGSPLYLCLGALLSNEQGLKGRSDLLAVFWRRESRQWQRALEERTPGALKRRRLRTALQVTLCSLMLRSDPLESARVMHSASSCARGLGYPSWVAEEVTLLLVSLYGKTRRRHASRELLFPTHVALHFVARTWAEHPEVLTWAAEGAAQINRHRLLRMAATAAQVSLDLEQSLEDFLRPRFADWVDQVAEVALSVGQPLGRILARLLEAERSYDLATRVEQVAPEQTVNLAEADLAAHEVICEHLRCEVDPNHQATLVCLARAETRRGVRLADLGRFEDAVSAHVAAERCLDRSLHTLESDALEVLGRARHNLGSVLGRRGSYAESIAASREALRVFHEARVKAPNKSAVMVARTLSNICLARIQTNELAGAESAGLKAVGILKRLCTEHSNEFAYDLARALDSLARAQMKSGSSDAARETWTHAEKVLRVGSRWVPEGWREQHCIILGGLAWVHRTSGQLARAEEYAVEGVRILKRLNDVRPGVFEVRLGELLVALSNIFDESDQDDSAMKTIEEAIQHFRSNRESGKSVPAKLATALANKGGRHYKRREFEIARGFYEQVLPAVQFRVNVAASRRA